MQAIELFRLRRVRDKPRALALIAAHTGLDHAAALAVLHAAIGGGRPRLQLPDPAAARACIRALAPTGFVARFAQAAEGGPAEQAQAALLRVQARLPAGVSDAIGAQLLAGAWEVALAHGLQYLGRHATPDDADLALLARTAVETGLVVGVPGRA